MFLVHLYKDGDLKEMKFRSALPSHPLQSAASKMRQRAVQQEGANINPKRLHYEIMQTLLGTLPWTVAQGSPFYPLTQHEQTKTFAECVPTLREVGIVRAQDEELTAVARTALKVIAKPLKRVRYRVVEGDKQAQVSLFSDGKHFVSAGFDHNEECFFSNAMTLEALLDILEKKIGYLPEGQAPPPPLQIDARTLATLGELHVAGLPLQGAQSTGMPHKTLQEQLVRMVGQDKATAFEEALFAEKILAREGTQCWFASAFAPWHQTAFHADRLDLQILELPLGQPPREPDPMGATFPGPSGQRAILWPTKNEYLDMLLARLHRKPLREALTLLLSGKSLDGASKNATLLRTPLSFRG